MVPLLLSWLYLDRVFGAHTVSGGGIWHGLVATVFLRAWYRAKSLPCPCCSFPVLWVPKGWGCPPSCLHLWLPQLQSGLHEVKGNSDASSLSWPLPLVSGHAAFFLSFLSLDVFSPSTLVSGCPCGRAGKDTWAPVFCKRKLLSTLLGFVFGLRQDVALGSRLALNLGPCAGIHTCTLTCFYFYLIF